MINLEIISIIVFLYWMFMLWETTRGLGNIRALPVSNYALLNRPLVSVIVAAKEEEASITDTVRHLLTQDYPRMELIVVNDRSEDKTGHKLEELKRWSQNRKDIHIQLKVIHITTIPRGWLGKNHALYQGYMHASGEYLLFTDADVQYAPNAIRDAVAYMQDEELDHLTLSPNLVAHKSLLRAFIHYFLFSFNLYKEPWRANDDRNRKTGMGIGAFNLIVRSVYRQIGTHRAIALRPDDDIQLGMNVKKAGFRQRLCTAKNHISVEWYPSLSAAINGLEKNTFAGFHYRLIVAFIAVVGQLFAFFFPFIGVWLPGLWSSILFGVSVLIMGALYMAHIRHMTNHRAYDVWLLPVSALLFVYALLRALVRTFIRGGIYWRGSFYSLHDLRSKRKPFDEE